METRILRAIEEVMTQNNRHYFSYIWREKVKNELKADSKYQKLLDWINAEINISLSLINVINPAEGELEYWDLYKTAMGKIAVLVHLREILLYQTCTDEMRASIERCFCEKMKIRYWEPLGEYLETGEAQ